MKQPGPIPAVLPRARVVIGEDDHLTVTLDGDPFPVPPEWAGVGRDAIGAVMDAVGEYVGQVVRIDITYPDGTTETEILTPDDTDQLRQDAPTPHTPPARPVQASANGSFLGVAEEGFRPGEPVSIAVVVTTATAGHDGVAALRLPPALLTRTPLALVLLGHDSGTLVLHDPDHTTTPPDPT
ncbi:hypothetical protein [Isoptericola sp. NPDC019482]|uniref:hypothetical protein n=1 Tax=Isoptericola sp. NPDC019482 TaxID=3154688 RepID=UPI003497110B